MTQKLNEQSNEHIQAAVMEKDPITELFELSNKHLTNLETKIWDFLKEHWIISNTENSEINNKIESYDWKIEWNTNNFEKIKTLKQTLDKEKKDIIKHHLVMKMISHTMIANSKDNLDLLEILKANNKKELFWDVVKIKNQELTEYNKELYEINNKYKKDIWYTEPKSKEQNIKEISQNLEKTIQKIAKNPSDTDAIKEFESNIQKSKDMWVEKEITQKLWKYLEYSMQSWVLPLAMMSNWTLRKALPMLPSVIWLWVWSRLMHGTMSDKAWALWETALAIAPITGTYIAYKDAMKAEWTWNKIAAWTWFAVSAWFDAFSVFLVATWVWAPAAVWTQALKVTAKEWAKLAVKKLFSFFSKEVTKESARSFTKKFIQQSLKDTVEWMWNILTFKGVREMKYLKNVLNKPFEQLSKKLEPWKIKTFQYLEEKWFVKAWATERLKNAGTAEEMRALFHESNQNNRPEDADILVRENEYKKIETVSTWKNLDIIFQKITALLENPNSNPKEIQETLNILKKQDEHIWNSMNILNEISKLVAKNNSKDNILNWLNTIINNNKWTISKNLEKYINKIIYKVKEWEDFSYKSLNFLELSNKLQWKIIQIDKSKKYPIIEKYKELVAKWQIEESKYWYQWNYQRLLNKLNYLLNSKKISDENYELLLKSYMDIIKNSETSWWWKIRAEIKEGSKDIEFKNWYEYNLYKLLSKNSYERTINWKKLQLIISKIDFSMIHNNELIELITKQSFNEIKNINNEIEKIHDEWNEIKLKSELESKAYESINLLWNLNKNKDISEKLHEYFKPAENQWLLHVLVDETESNIALIKLLPFLENKNIANKKIIANLDKNDQINKWIWIDKKSMTRKNLDSLLRDIEKMWDKDYKIALNIVVEKIIWKWLPNWLKDFTKLIESYDVAAKIHSLYPNETKTFANSIISWDNYSTEYKIKFLINIKWNESSYKELIKIFKNQITEKIEQIDLKNLNDSEYNQLIKDIDNIESFLIKDSKINTNNTSLSNQQLINKIINIKNNSKQYKQQKQNINKTLKLLLDLDRTFNLEYLKTQKTSWNITFQTKALIKQKIENISELNNSWELVIKKWKEDEYKKLNQLYNQVSEVLTHYELNLFDPAKFNILKNKAEKIDYIFDMINQQSWWKLDKNFKWEINYNLLVRDITKQLNSVTNHFNIDKWIIDWVISKLLQSTNMNWLDVSKKIYLLRMLEKSHIIKPSAEQKLDYIIDTKAKDSIDLRKWTHYIKDYIKNLWNDVKETNLNVEDIKSKYNETTENWKQEVEKEMVKYIKSIIDKKTPVSNESIKKRGNDFIKWRDYVVIDSKNYVTEVYPYRYFVTELVKWKIDLKTKEAYMEFIANSDDFGWKTIKDYFNETNDIESKILLTYHKDLKYEKDSIKLLAKYSSDPKYKDLIAYVIQKRQDLELIKWSDNWKLTREYLETQLTKDIIEKEEWIKISNDEYNKIKENIIKMILNNKSLYEINSITKSERNEINKRIELERANKIIENIATDKKLLTETIDNSLMWTATWIAKIEFKNWIDNIYNKLILKLKDNPKIVLDDKILTNEIKTLIENEAVFNKKWIKQLFLNSKTELIEIIKQSLFKYLFAGRAGLNANEQFKNWERKETLSIAKNFINDNKKILILPVIWKILMDPTESGAAVKIADQWESSPQYPEYIKAMESWNLKTAIKIKKAAVNEITKMVLKDYIADFKDKYEAKYLSRFQEFPLWLRDLTSTIHEKLSPMVKEKTVKWRNAFAKWIYDFIKHYNSEDWKAEKYARKLLDKVEWWNWTPLANLIINMWKQSDIEASKSPEQKQREHEDFIRKENEKQRKENEKQFKIRKEIDASQRNIDSSQRNIDSSQRNIDKRQKIIDDLNWI